MSSSKEADFLKVMEGHKGILYKIAHSYCKDAEDRKDLVQDILVQLWKSFENYNDAYRHSTWIYRIALNVAISFYRKERTRSKLAAPFNEGIFSFAANTDPAEKESRLLLLQQLIYELKELDKALMLLYLEEKSYKEMAEIMGLTETNVATKIGRLKTALKEKMNLLLNP